MPRHSHWCLGVAFTKPSTMPSTPGRDTQRLGVDHSSPTLQPSHTTTPRRPSQRLGAASIQPLIMASSSAPLNVFDDHRFRKEFNQQIFESHVRRKKVIPEVGFNLDEGEYPQIMEHIMLWGWRRLAAPMTGVSKLLVQ
ncbi:hypothetical protein PIB30_083134 [Stylosanthes scabra]|uniref:Uncharacterized protein n=1 Tax=Stylosanthes scabra TaxID=79078 RepID=A0ABU6ZQS8_9FABA|nr:hypothetical protein [Stylosanthes scabra]